MMFFKLIVLICVVLASVSWSKGTFVNTTEDAFFLTNKIIEQINETWEVSLNPANFVEGGNATIVSKKDMEQLILYKFDVVQKLVHSFQENLDDILNAMLDGIKEIHSTTNVILSGIKINELIESIKSIEDDFITMGEYILSGTQDMSNLDENSSYEVYSLQKFAEAMLYSSIKSPSKEILKIHRSLVLERDRYDSKADDYGIFKMIKDLTENGEMLCYVKQSLHQLIYNVYKVLYLTQLKGFSIVEFSRLILQTNGLGNFQNEYKKQKDQFENKINMQILSLKSMLSSSNNIYWRCDPYSHKKDVSYYEVAPILQGFIENEVHMSPQHSCKQNCAFYEHSPVYRCSSNQFCAKQHSCNGELLNCQYIESDMNVCQSPFGSSRRYEYITYKKGTVLGDRSINCNGTYSKVNSWWRWLVWHCSYCLCICYSTDTASDQYFSLQPSLSDISQNKIVTGVKFNKVNNIFHLQVQEGILGPRGYINESSRSWVTLLRPEFIYNNSLPQEGVDFFKLSYFSRTIDIDNVMAPKTTVVTGVKFRSIGTHISIEIRVTPFDFSSGNLIQPNIKSYWVGNEDANFSNVERTEIKIDNSDLPTKLKIPSVPDMTAHKYVKFTHSSITRDVAQTTLPFIDKQTVEPFPAIPLSGVGIYFKGIENYGGFIGANVFTYNFSTHISTRLI